MRRHLVGPVTKRGCRAGSRDVPDSVRSLVRALTRSRRQFRGFRGGTADAGYRTMKRLSTGFIVLAVLVACGSNGNSNPGGGSALCGVNGTNACGGQQTICSGTLGCVQCQADSDCAATDPRCIEGRCHACATNADCGAAMPACWADHQCHAACTSNASCQQQTQPNLPLCDTSTGACIECMATKDCAGTQQPLCDTSTDRCVDCLANSDCGVSAPRCFLGDHTCVQCLSNSDCGTAAPICDSQNFACRQGCTENSQCSGTTPLCNTTTSTCVACLKNTDCTVADPICTTNDGRCVVCVVDADCAQDAGTMYCDNQGGTARCVQCAHDNQCPQSAPNCNNGTCGP